MQTSSPGEKRLFFYCNALFGLSLLLECIFVLHLPLFPSGDGPLHLYYSRILWSLATHQQQYQHYYAIRHLIGVYSIHYFVLLLFEKVVSPARAEELFVVIILANTAFGFRFLAGRLGQNAAVASVWMIPLLLNWPLGAGFFNYCFAAGMLYWALGFWISLPPAGSRVALVGFTAALIMLVFSHPVPLALLLLFQAADLTISLIEERKSNGRLNMGKYSIRLIALALNALAIVLPAMLIQKGNMRYHLSDFYPHKYLILAMVNGQLIGLFGGNHIVQVIYTEAVLFIVPGVIFVMATQLVAHLRDGATTAADRLLMFSVLFLLATFCFPPTLNGSSQNPERFWSLLWPMVLACGAAGAVRTPTLRWVSVAGTALIFTTGVLAFRTLLPIARMQSELSQVRLPSGSKGVFLQDWVLGRYPLGLSYSVFYWSGVRAWVNGNAILLNSPWINQTHLPLEENGHSGLLADYFGWDHVEPPLLLEKLSVPSAERDITLRKSDFFLFSDPVHRDLYLKDTVHAILRNQQNQWSCEYGSYFVLCEKR